MTTQARNWNDLANIVDAANLNEKDEACLSALQDVIEGYGLECKFGISLLHKHFDIQDDEMLVENNSASDRQLLTAPKRASEVDAESLITTVWRFDQGARYGCTFCNKDHCDQDIDLI